LLVVQIYIYTHTFHRSNTHHKLNMKQFMTTQRKNTDRKIINTLQNTK